MSRALLSFVLLSLFTFSCGGGESAPAKSADDVAAESSGASSSDNDGASAKPASDDEAGEGSKPKAKSDEPSAAEPQFTEGMSVDEAIKAVPAGIERRNIDQETLGKPLQDVSVYEPCKPGSAHVKIKVAVWDGRAVGVDVTSTPKNEKLSSCIKQKISELKWEKKVKSLNTIEYQL
ncbi:MAG TPA: hypothetical protein VFQ35_05985 [Polyangiaceae bacterium]|nr:hypothetical protein [Polyangiaceae bacterium]